MTRNLTQLLLEQLSPSALAALREVASAATALGVPVYLVGGTVRDILLGIPTQDLDFTVVGNGQQLAWRYAEAHNGRLVAHSQFGTARVKAGELTLDFATARREHYPHPGSLPQIQPGALEDDLFRRDFSVNAMAIDLNPGQWGALIDRFDGRQDLEQRAITVLHERSFQDDATRMMRAARYAHRLGFRLSEDTRRLVQRDARYLQRVSGPRRWKELEKTLHEAAPEGALRLDAEWGLLEHLHPALSATDKIRRSFPATRALAQKNSEQGPAYLCLLTYDAAAATREALVREFRLPKRYAVPLADLGRIQDMLAALSVGSLRPSQAVEMLERLAPPAILAASLLVADRLARERLGRYLAEWRHLRPHLSPRDLTPLGIPEGRSTGQLLAELRKSRLDGAVQTRQDEVNFVRSFLQTRSNSW